MGTQHTARQCRNKLKMKQDYRKTKHHNMHVGKLINNKVVWQVVQKYSESTSSQVLKSLGYRKSLVTGCSVPAVEKGRYGQPRASSNTYVVAPAASFHFRQASSGGCNAPKVYTLSLKAHPPLLKNPVRLTSTSRSDKDTILLWFPSNRNGANSQAVQIDLLSKHKLTIVSYMGWWGCNQKSAYVAWLVTSWLVSSSKRLPSGDHQQDVSGL